MGVARVRGRLRDPAYRAAFRKKTADAMGARVQTTCVICGAVFETPRYELRHGQSKVGADGERFRELRRRYAREHSPYWRSAAYRDTSARLRALPAGPGPSSPGRTAHSPGSASGAMAAQTHAELAERFGISTSRV